MSTHPVSTPESKSNFLWWVLGLFCAGVVILALSGLVVAAYLARYAQVNRTAARVEIRTPVGQLTVAKNHAQETGLPLYPGASAIESKQAGIEFTTPEDERVVIAAAHYTTSDPFERVDAWYRERLGPDFVRESSGPHVHKVVVQGVHTGPGDIAFISDKDDLVRVVAIKKRWKGVEIALARVGKQEAQ